MRCSSPWRLGSIARPCTGFGNASGARWMWSSSAASCRTASKLDLVDLGDRDDVARQRLRDLDVVLALEHEEVARP